ncbi:hypothetical protein AAFF_G00111200 [Aldrovandia affinis]|uniref:Uncharacterized protein n=1 Tax=Aldrovandia affinis TaxID=143900 RepID=A0AAD7RTI4_9TELE|nr:hypothetical protein AAFF_G00111200 [Aldrovandia affinis]
MTMQTPGVRLQDPAAVAVCPELEVHSLKGLPARSHAAAGMEGEGRGERRRQLPVPRPSEVPQIFLLRLLSATQILCRLTDFP